MKELNGISASDSVKIDKELIRIKTLIDEADNYYFAEKPKEKLEILKADIDDIFSNIMRILE